MNEKNANCIHANRHALVTRLLLQRFPAWLVFHLYLSMTVPSGLAQLRPFAFVSLAALAYILRRPPRSLGYCPAPNPGVLQKLKASTRSPFLSSFTAS